MGSFKFNDNPTIRDTRFGRKPRNAIEALKQARAFLVDEGKQHWCKGTVFTPVKNNPETEKRVDPDNPMCGNWGVCAIGAVALVTGDLKVSDVVYLPYGDRPVYEAATSLLDEVTTDDEKVVKRLGYEPEGIVEFNDNPKTKRADVIRLFDKAIALGEQKANEKRGRNAAATKRKAGAA